MSQFKSYFATMPWLAIPPGDKRNGKLNKLYGVRGIPTLVLVDGATGVTINANGRTAVDDDEGWLHHVVLLVHVPIFYFGDENVAGVLDEQFMIWVAH